MNGPPYVVSLQRSQKWLAFFLLFFIMCFMKCPHGLTGITMMSVFHVTMMSSHKLFPSWPAPSGQFFVGFRIELKHQSLLEAWPNWHPGLVFPQHPEQSSNRKAVMALHYHDWLTSPSSLWGACSVRVGLVSCFTQWSNQYTFLPLAAHSKGSNVAWSNVDLSPLPSLVKGLVKHCIDHNLAMWPRFKTNLDPDEQSNPPTFLSRLKGSIPASSRRVKG